MSDRRALLRTLPAIDRLLGSAILKQLEDSQPHLLIRDAAQQVVDGLRQQLLDEQAALPDLNIEAVAEQVASEARLETLAPHADGVIGKSRVCLVRIPPIPIATFNVDLTLGRRAEQHWEPYFIDRLPIRQEAVVKGVLR